MKKILLFLLTIILIPVVNASTEVSSFGELKTAIDNGETSITISEKIYFNSTIPISSNVTINGNNKTIERAEEYKGELFNISSSGTLELSNITLDGGAPNWQLDVENSYTSGKYARFPSINYSDDIQATTAVINNNGTLKLNKATIQNTFSTANGGAIIGNGNNEIIESTIIHNGTKMYGGAFYITGGTTVIKKSRFESNSCGVTNEGIYTFGGAIYSKNLNNLTIEDTTFFNNISEHDGGALAIYGESFQIKNTIFKQNHTGNDGAAIIMDTATNKNVSIIDSTFEENHGYSITTNQSLGTIYVHLWDQPKDNPFLIKNTKFRGNIVAAGGAIVDSQDNFTNIKLENCKIYENEATSGGGIYTQKAYYTIDNTEFHDNTVTDGGAIYIFVNSEVTLHNVKIYNNKSANTGGAVNINHGAAKFYDSLIYNNSATSFGGAFFISNMQSDYQKQYMELTNTTVTNNSATSGGAVYLLDYKRTGLDFIMGANSKIYNNSATVYGDDIVYMIFGNNSSATRTVQLQDPTLFNIPGIDGWYEDKYKNRYKDVDEPQKCEDLSDYKGTSLFLKAGGYGQLDYDLQGGENEEIKPLVLKYGVPYVVDENVPIKEGYEFKGWNTKKDGSGTWYYANDVYDGSEGLVLYAQYAAIIEDEVEEEIPENPNTGDIIKQLLIVLICLLFIVLFNIKKISRKMWFKNS